MYKGSAARGGISAASSVQPIAIVRVDASSDATRVTVMDRFSTHFRTEQLVVAGEVNFIRVPFRYSISSRLIVTMLDDDLNFAANCVDGVKAETLDGRTLNMRGNDGN
ncbi:hypothetical protein [Shewanella algae]|uniref:hypothetical protein n=1 Tax=Shewanella algae TaxID=38313 RepID=UPI001AAD9FD7|nr:hypothetical protein [Shewanella algae]MBO2563808.1 hypothetical protein [Shewanella algae]